MQARGSYLRSLGRSVSAFVLVGFTVSSWAASFGPPQLVSQHRAAEVDAAKIAEAVGVSVNEATQRLQIQKSTGELGRSLRQTHADRLAGLYREWTPEPGFVVVLKGSEPVANQSHTVDGKQFAVRFKTGASHTLAELVAAQKDRGRALAAAFPSLQSTRIDERSGELVISVQPRDAGAQSTARAAAISGVPTRVEVGDTPRSLALSGSGGLTIGGIDAACTGGFVVISNDTQTPGLVTAGHCPNNATVAYTTLDAQSYNLSLVAEAWDGTQDLQWYTGNGDFEATFFSDDTTLRVVQWTVPKEFTNVGDALCFFGQSSGQNCGVVDSLNFNPNLPNNGCGGQACQAEFVSVAGSGLLCNAGDSGGPVFQEAMAYGILSGGAFSQSTGQCTRFFYTPVDKLENLGIRVMIPF